MGCQACGACRRGRRLQRLPRRGDQVHRVAVEGRVARLRCFAGAGLQRGPYGGRHVDAVAHQGGERVGTGAGIGHGGAAGDDRGVVARHIADAQRHHARRRAGRSQAPALDAREVLAHAVHLADGGTAGQQGLVDALLIGQRQAFAGQREQRRAAARDQAQHQVAGAQPLGQRQHALGGGLAGGIGHGVGSLGDFDALH